MKQYLQKFLALVLAISMVLGLCPMSVLADDVSNSFALKGAAGLSNASYTMVVGESRTYASHGAGVTYTSGNSAVASASADGVISAVSAGTAAIVATDGSSTAVIVVVVSDASITAEPKTMTIVGGETEYNTPSVKAAGAYTVTAESSSSALTATYNAATKVVEVTADESVTEETVATVTLTLVDGAVTVTDSFTVTILPKEEDAVYHTVTFMDQFSGVVAIVSVKDGEDVALPTAPELEGYTYAGYWTVGSDQVTDMVRNVTSDLTCRAIYTRNSYTVSFSTAYGTAPAAQTIEENNVAAKPSFAYEIGQEHTVQVRVNNKNENRYYRFLGWQLNGEDFDFNTPITEDLTLTAHWEQVMCTIYFVTFKGVLQSTIVEKGSSGSVTAPTVSASTNSDHYTYTYTNSSDQGKTQLFDFWTNAAALTIDGNSANYDMIDGGSSISYSNIQADLHYNAVYEPTSTDRRDTSIIKQDDFARVTLTLQDEYGTYLGTTTLTLPVYTEDGTPVYQAYLNGTYGIRFGKVEIDGIEVILDGKKYVLDAENTDTSKLRVTWLCSDKTDRYGMNESRNWCGGGTWVALGVVIVSAKEILADDVATLNVKYYAEKADGTQTLLESINATVFDGNRLSCAGYIKTYSNYAFKSVQWVTGSEGATVVGGSSYELKIFYKSGPYCLTVNYIDRITGNPITDPHEEELDKGEGYTVPSPNIPGYTPETPVVKGSMGNGEVEVTVYYKKNVNFIGETANKTYDGTTQFIDGITPDGLIAGHKYSGLTYRAEGKDVQEGGYAGSFTGTVQIFDGSTNVTANYAITTTPGTLTIDPAQVTLKSKDLSKQYDGQPLENGDNPLETESGWIGNEGATYTFTGTQTLPNSSPNSFDYQLINGAKAENYSISKTEGTLTVTKGNIEVKFIGKSNTVPYNGGEQTVTGYTVEGLKPGHTYTASLSFEAKGTDANSTGYTGTFTGVDTIKIFDEKNNDVTGNYDIKTPAGTLIITQAPLKIIAGSANQQYNGKPLTCSTYSVDEDTPLKGSDTITSVTLTGSVTRPGTEANVASDAVIMNGSKNVKANYTIEYVPGTLTVTKGTIGLSFSGEEKTVPYNGYEQTSTGFSVTGLLDGHTYSGISYEAKGTDANADGYTGSFTGVGTTLKVYDEEGYEVTDNYNITTPAGKLIIEPAPLKIIAGSDSKTYDGTPLTKNSYSVDSTAKLLGNDTITSVTVTGSRTLVGSSDNVASDAEIMNGSKDVKANYAIEYVPGKLTVDQAAIEVNFVGETKTLVYNGGEQSLTGITRPTALLDGHYFEGLKYEAKGTDVKSGGYTGTFTGVEDMKIFDENGNDVTKNYVITTTPGTLTISQAPLKIIAGSATKPYDGDPLTCDTYSVDPSTPLKGNDEITSVTITGSQTLNNKSANVASDAVIENGSGNVNFNYAIEYVNGELDVTKGSIKASIVAENIKKPYNGALQQSTGYKAEGLHAGHKVTADLTYLAQGTTVATYYGSFGGELKILDENGNNVTENYQVSKKTGTLEIEKAPLKIIAGSKQKKYDGTALTYNYYEVSDDTPLFGGDTITSVTVAGSQTAVGESDNIASAAKVENGGNSRNFCYDITYEKGVLEVTDNNVAIVVKVKENSCTTTYDGNSHNVTGYTLVEISHPSLYSEADFSYNGDKTSENYTITKTEAGTYELNILASDFSNNNSAFTNVTFQVVEQGQLKINQAPLKIKAGSASREYNGNALTCDSYSVDSTTPLKGKDKIESVKVAGSQTAVGDSDNIASDAVIKNGSGDPVTKNYAITYEKGTLSVKACTDEIIVTILENSGSKTYDGDPMTIEGYTVKSISSTLYKTADFEYTQGSGHSVTGTNANTYDLGIVPGDFKNISKNFANVKFVVEDGQLEIKQAPLTIKAKDAAREYNGQPLTCDEFETTGTLYKGAKVTKVTIEGSQKDQGSSPNTAKENTAVIELPDGTGVTGNYKITYQPGTLTVTPYSKKITVTVKEDSGSKTYDGDAMKIEGYTFVSIEGDEDLYDESFFSYIGDKNSESYSITRTNAGTYDLGIVPEDFRNDNPNFSNVVFVVKDGQLEIKKKEVILKSKDLTQEYNGQPLVNGDEPLEIEKGWVKNEGATYDFTGTQTDKDVSTNSFTYTLKPGTDPNNYDIKKTEGTLTVTAYTAKVTVTLQEDSCSTTYDGDAHTITGYKQVSIEGDQGLYKEADYSYTGDKTSENYSITRTNAGTYDLGIVPADFVNNNKNFTNVEFVVKQGQLEIKQAPLTIKAKDAKKPYDGNPLTCNEFETTGTLYKGAKVTAVTIEGTRTTVGSEPNVAKENTAVIELPDGTKVTDNYKITYQNGTLTVEPTEDMIVVTVKENGLTKKYDGQEVTVSGYTLVSIEGGDGLYKKEYFTYTPGEGDSVTATDAGTYELNIKDTDFKNDNPNFDKVVFVVQDNSLVIEKRNVTLTSADDTKTYDGKPLTNNTVKVTGDGFVNGEGASYDFTGTQTDTAVSKNSFTYELIDGAKDKNYNITKVEGDLTVKAYTDKVTVTLQEDNFSTTYDGDQHTITGYKQVSITGDKGLYKEADYSYTGDKNSESYSITRTNAGTYDLGIVPEDFVNNNKNFTNVEFVVKQGQLVIEKKVVTLKSKDLTQEYNGEPLENGSTPLEIEDGWVKDEGATYDFTGTQTDTAVSKNSFTVNLKPNTDPNNYDIRKTEGDLTVTAYTDKVTVTILENSGSKTYDGDPMTVSGYTVKSISTKLYKTADFEYTQGSGHSVTGINANTYDLGIVPGDFKNISKNFTTVEFKVEDGKLEIKQAPLTIKAKDAEQYFNGRALTCNAFETTGTLYKGAKVTEVTIEGSQTTVGDSPNVAKVGSAVIELPDGTKVTNNYYITYQNGTLTVKASEGMIVVTVKEKGLTKTYDGQPATVSGYDLVSIKDDKGLYTKDDFTYTPGPGDSVTATDAGTYELNIKDTDFKNTNPNFSNVVFVVEDNSLVIEKRKVTLTSGDSTEAYDGQPLKNETVKVTGDGFAPGEGATYDFTGSQLDKGSSSNSFDYTLQPNTKAKNYEITKEEGTLTVTPITTPIVITADSSTKPYDGTPLKGNGFTNTPGVLVNGDILTATVTGSQTDAGESPSVITGYKVTRNGKDITDNYTFALPEPGTLTVEKRKVTLTSGDGSKTYDGTPLTNKQVTVGGSGFAFGEGATFTVTGTQTDAGSSDNLFTYTLNGNTKADNYDITPKAGTLTVNPYNKQVTVTITEKNAVVPFDRAEHSLSGYESIKSDTKLYDVKTSVKETPTAAWTATGTAVGIYPLGILAADFENINKNFTNVVFKIAEGALEIDGSSIIPVKSTPAVSDNYDLGDAVPFTIKVENVSAETVEKVTVNDPSAKIVAGSGYTVTGDHTAVITDLAAGAIVNVKAEHTVTEADILAHKVSNTANVTWPDGSKSVSAETDKVEPKASYTVKKTASAPASGKDYFALGEEVEYTITVVNTGNVTLKNIKITDVLSNGKSLTRVSLTSGVKDKGNGKFVISTLKPFDKSAGTAGMNSVSFKVYYTITTDDLGSGTISNGVTAKATPPTGVTPPKDPDSTVTVKVDEAQYITAAIDWVDAENKFDTRPANVQLKLLSDEGTGTMKPAGTAKLTEQGGWSKTYKLPAHNTDGDVINYAVVQGGVDHYNTTVDPAGADNYTSGVLAGDSGSMQVTFTNTLEKHKLTVDYDVVDYKGDVTKGEPDTYTRYHGWDYSIKIPEIPGYSPDVTVLEGDLTEDTSIQIVYKPNTYRLVIEYLYAGTLDNAVPRHSEEKLFGEPFSVESPFLMDHLISQKLVEGTMNQPHDMHFTVWYTPLNEPIEPSVPLGFGSASLAVGECAD